MKKLGLLFVILLFINLVSAVPSVNPIESNLVHGSQISISGVDFGFKNHNQALIFDNIDSIDAYSSYDTSHGSIVPTRGTYGVGEGNPLQYCLDCPWYNHEYGRVPRFYIGENSRYSNHTSYLVRNLADTDGRKGFFARNFDINDAEGWTYVDWWFRASHDFGQGPGGFVSGKVLRKWHDASTVDQLVLANVPGSLFATEMHGCMEWVENDYFGSIHSMREGEWEHVKVITHVSPSEVKSWAIVDGILVSTWSDFSSCDGIYDHIRMIGYDPSISANLDPDMEFLFGDISFDDSLSRIVIADTNSFDPFGNSYEVHYEMQELVSWSTDVLAFKVNQGSFLDTDSLYLFVIDEDGTVSNGVPVSFSSGVIPDCSLTSASWSTTTADEGTQVTLTVNGNNCDGKQLDFELFDTDDFLLFVDLDPVAVTNPASTTFSSGVATQTWITEWVDDTDGGDSDPEYVFVASLNEDSLINIESSNNLKVSQVIPGVPHVGDVSNLGVLRHGDSFNISGSSFGVKSPVAPWLRDDFEQGIINEIISGPRWSTGSEWGGFDPVYSDDVSRGNNNIVSKQGTVGTSLLGADNYPDGCDGEIYITGWFYGTETESSSSMKFMNLNAGGWDYPAIRTGGDCSGWWRSGVWEDYNNNIAISSIGGTPFRDSWERWEWVAHFGTDGLWQTFRNLEIESEIVDNFYFGEGRCTDSIYFSSYYGVSSACPDNANGLWYWDEVYVDNTVARIEICNNQNKDLATNCEIQIPHTTWDGTTIQFSANQGALNSDQTYYLFVIDADGTVSNGKEISFTAAVGCTDGNTRSCGSNVGECSAGTETCSGGTWGSCVGEILPNDEEICGNGLDDDCDTLTDEDCGCILDAECEDSNVCTTDSCNAGTCVNTPNTNSCDDGITCTENDICSAGTCGAGTLNDLLCPVNENCLTKTCTATGCSYSDCTVSGTLISHLTLDLDYSDVTGSYNGVCTSCPTQITGQLSGAYDFDGIANSINMGDVQVNNEITITAWVNPDVVNSCGPRIISKASGTQTADHYWMMGVCDGEVRTRIKAGGITDTLVGGTISELEGFVHLAVSYDGTTIRIYKNGIEVASQLHSIGGNLDLGTGVDTLIGFNTGGSADSYFDGIIDDVRIYESALSSIDIQAVMIDGDISTPTCTDSDGDTYSVEGGVCGEVDCNDDNSGINPGIIDSSCNGIDEDCSTVADQDYVSISTSCGVGECSSLGSTSCSAGSIVDSCTAGSPNAEICDGLDNNCEGNIDEDLDCGSSGISQTINLDSGWNVVSLGLVNSSLTSADLESTYVMRYNNGWESDWNGVSGDEFSLEALRGYYVYSSSAKSLTFSGSLVSSEYSLIDNTWNLVSFNSTVAGSGFAVSVNGGVFDYVPVAIFVPGAEYWVAVGDVLFGPPFSSSDYTGVVDWTRWLFSC
ncbi:hypothetical protein HN865_00510 [Candidatus Woesearchaeota archaeon]|nr:hypothetical protein [Candidatus Woesearchaeota archaeon]